MATDPRHMAAGRQQQHATAPQHGALGCPRPARQRRGKGSWGHNSNSPSAWESAGGGRVRRGTGEQGFRHGKRLRVRSWVSMGDHVSACAPRAHSNGRALAARKRQAMRECSVRCSVRALTAALRAGRRRGRERQIRSVCTSSRTDYASGVSARCWFVALSSVFSTPRLSSPHPLLSLHHQPV